MGEEWRQASTLHKVTYDGEIGAHDCSVWAAAAISGLPYLLCKELLHTNMTGHGTLDGSILALMQGCGYLMSRVESAPAFIKDIPTSGLFWAAISTSDGGHSIVIENGMACDSLFQEPAPVAEGPWRETPVLRLWRIHKKPR